MPDSVYHEEKRDRFRDTGSFLRSVSQTNVSLCDANVQDFFYAMVHETERFFREAFDFDSRGHGKREARINNWMVVRSSNPESRMIKKSVYYRNRHRYGNALPVLDRRSRHYYMWLRNLRMDLVYGETKISVRRHADYNDVTTARESFQRFRRSLANHIRNLRRNHLI